MVHQLGFQHCISKSLLVQGTFILRSSIPVGHCVLTLLHTQQDTAALTLERGSGHLHFSWIPPGLVGSEVFHPWFNMDGWLSPLVVNNKEQC